MEIIVTDTLGAMVSYQGEDISAQDRLMGIISETGRKMSNTWRIRTLPWHPGQAQPEEGLASWA